MSDHYVSPIFPTSKSIQDSHALTPPAPTAPIYTKAQVKQQHYTTAFFPSNILEPVLIHKEHMGLAEQHHQ